MLDDMRDPEFCARKADEYRRLARAASDWLLRRSLEAIAREYDQRAVMLRAGDGGPDTRNERSRTAPDTPQKSSR